MKLRVHHFVILLVSLLFVSCSKPKGPSLSLDDKVSWAMATENGGFGQALAADYKPLDLYYGNLSDLVGFDPQYLWIKIDFVLPPQLQNQNLGFVIPYIHFSEQCWFNGNFIGQQGTFYPDPYSTMYSSFYHTLPESLVNNDGPNTIYLKVLSQGHGTVSEGLFLANVSVARVSANWLNYIHSKIYMMFEGILICAAIFFFILYMAHKKEQRYLFNFVLVCVSTCFLMAYFFGTELPGYADGVVSYLAFTKICLCCSLYCTIYTLVGFLLEFVGEVQTRTWKYFKRTVLATMIIITLAAPDIEWLMKLTMPMFIALILHVILGFAFVTKALLSKEHRLRGLVIIIGFFPLGFSIVTDFIIRSCLRNNSFPFFTTFGWEITIVFLIIYFSLQYNHLFMQNEKLTKDLQHEVDIQTADLSLAKEKLEIEWERSQKEMQMAAVVQSKFLTQPEQAPAGWELAFRYAPLEQISGDLYDFYIDDKNILNGIALFDVSGHGVAASLITMLSKNIISHEFKKTLGPDYSVSDALIRTNEKVLKAKADVENYLTGLILRFGYSDSDECAVQLGSAGHPYPIYYDASVNDVIDLTTLEIEDRYGVIGMKDMDISIPNIDFSVKKDDILVCFSDGVTETSNEEREAYGRARLENMIIQNHEKSADEIIECIKEDVLNFRGENPREDDITIIVLKRK